MSLGNSARKAVAALGSIAVITALAVALPTAASAAEEVEVAAAPFPQTVSADALPTAQIDSGVVWSIKVVGDIAYAGGQFSNARPPGAAPGTNLVPRSNVLAFNIKTGQLTSWAPVINGRVNDITASPDGTKLYVVGTFTQVDGVERNRIAVFNLPSGSLSSVAPNLNGPAQSVAATNSTVYVGGYFSAVNNSSRARIAAVNASNGALLPFRPIVDNGMVQSLAVNPEGTKVVLSGSFTSIFAGQNEPGYGLAMVDAVSGASLPLPANSEVRNAGDSSGITNLATDGTNFYGVGWHYGGGGNVEGSFSARWSDGGINWVEDCHGDTYDIAPAGDLVYMASHKHYCGNSGGFPQTEPWTFRHSTVVTKTAEGINTPDIYGYPDHDGVARPEILNWYPQTDVGTFTGKSQAVWSVEGTSDYVIYGGEFPRVNGTTQQGLVRYATRAIAPNKSGPRLRDGQTTWNPSVMSFTAGSVRLSYTTLWDRDDLDLTYRVYRDTENAAGLVDTRTVSAPFWKPQAQKFTQTGLTPGATHRYRVVASDPYGNLYRSDWVNVTVSELAAGPYVQDVFQDDVANFWRLGEPSGSAGIDWAGSSDLALNGSYTQGATGAINGDTDKATTFSDGYGSSNTMITAPDSFAVEAWFKTSSNSGGKIIGFGNAATGNSSSYDRHVYLDNSGRIWFGVHPGGVRTINTTTTYRDNQWHHVVASLGANGMRLFVDGKLVAQRPDVTSGQAYTGNWRVGNDNLGGWTNRPSSDKFEGTIDDVAVYSAPLDAARVQSHWRSSGRSATVPNAPADSYGALIYNAGPEFYWRFDETFGSSVADAGAQAVNGTLAGTYQRGQTGALVGNVGRAVAFTGNGGNAYTNLPFPTPGAFTLETWFKTTTTTGGKLIGFGDAQTGNSGNYDRHIYMQDNGQLVFGTWTGVANTVTTPSAYNDGAWHHVVGVQGSDGIKLYVDGALIGSHPETSGQAYTGYWRVGGDTTWGSSTSNLRGTFDETAVYAKALSASDVATHYAVAKGTPVPNAAPTASFTQSSTGMKVSVDASASSDSDGTISSYSWNWDDGTPAGSGATASHTYAEGGTYTITLTVTDDDGATGTTTQSVTYNIAPTASFTASADGTKVTVDAAASSDPDGSVASYSWSWGDGTPSGTGSATSHTYAAGGDYTITLTVTDDDGATASTTRSVEVVVPNVAPTASFTTSGSGLDVSVNGSGSADSDGSIASYSWNWGDGSAAGSGATASHTYASGGDYTITLTVTDDDGATGTTTRSVTAVVPGAGVLASDEFSRTVSSGWGSADVGGAWTLRGGATRFSVADGAGKMTMPSALTVYADLNGVSSTSTRVDAVFSVDKLVEGQYVAVVGRRVGSENYIARLRLQADGGVRLYLLQDSAASIAPMLQVPITIVPGEKYVLAMETTGSGTTTVKAKLWKQSEAEPAWQRQGTNSAPGLQAPGAVSVFSFLPTTTLAPVVVSYDKITVTDPTGVVTPPPANVAPTASFTTSGSGLDVSVNGSGSADSDGSIASYSWNWGDGSAAGSGATASHTYASGGDYTITLTVTDDDGATGTTTRSVTAVVPGAGVLASDEFSRTVSSGWGSADVGGAWTLRGGATRFSVADGAGKMTMPSALTVYADLNGVSSTSTRVDAVFSVDKLVEGQYVAVVGRRVGSENYIARLRLQADGGVRLYLLQDSAASIAPMLQVPITIVPGEKYVLAMETTGSGTTTVKAKLWKQSEAEPAWQRQGTNSAPGLQAPGAVSVFSFLPTTTLAPVVVSYDKITVTDPTG